MTLEELPKFHVEDKVVRNAEVKLVGRIACLVWVKNNSAGCLFLGAGHFIWGRFASIVEQGTTAEFLLAEPTDLSAFVVGQEYPYFDGY